MGYKNSSNIIQKMKDGEKKHVNKLIQTLSDVQKNIQTALNEPAFQILSLFSRLKRESITKVMQNIPTGQNSMQSSQPDLGESQTEIEKSITIDEIKEIYDFGKVN